MDSQAGIQVCAKKKHFKKWIWFCYNCKVRMWLVGQCTGAASCTGIQPLCLFSCSLYHWLLGFFFTGKRFSQPLQTGMLWLVSFISMRKIQTLQSWIMSSVTCLWQAEGCTTSLSPAPWRSATMLDGNRNCWMEASSCEKCISVCATPQILKITNKL